MGLLRATDEGAPPREKMRRIYEQSGVGEADYQRYDRDITRNAIDWLKREGTWRDRPWLLFVSYASPHPPFSVPARLYDMYPPDTMPLPVQFSPETRPDHPAIVHLRKMSSYEESFSEELVRRTVAGYCGLVTHVDGQIGEVMALTVPLIAAGPGIGGGRSVRQIVSHVDLFPTLCEAMGVALEDADADLPGISLWPAINGREADRQGFAEFHSHPSRVGEFMLRDGDYKLVLHIGMPPQLFDLKSDPMEMDDLIPDGRDAGKRAVLDAKLRRLIDPEAIDRQAKADQVAQIETNGGAAAIFRILQCRETP